MRCSQPYGLPKEAEQYLKEYAVKFNYCEHCARHDGYKTEKTDKYYGMYDEFPLKKYKLKNGEFAEEFVQYSIWSSGPMEWLGLKTPEGDITWNQQEICKQSKEMYKEPECKKNNCPEYDKCDIMLWDVCAYDFKNKTEHAWCGHCGKYDKCPKPTEEEYYNENNS